MTKEMQTKVEDYARVHKFLLNQTKLDAIDWYLDNVWHNENEEPEKDSLILLIMQSGTPVVAKIIEPNHTFSHGERWAYIDDLLEKESRKATK